MGADSESLLVLRALGAGGTSSRSQDGFVGYCRIAVPSAAQLMEKQKGLKSRGGSSCSEEPGNVLLRWVGESCLTSRNICTYPLPSDLASAKKIKIQLDLIRAALRGLKSGSGCLIRSSCPGEMLSASSLPNWQPTPFSSPS